MKTLETHPQQGKSAEAPLPLKALEEGPMLAALKEELSRMQWQHRAMMRLVFAVQELSLCRNLESIMGVVRKAARELTGADGATFVLREGDQCYYAEEDAIAPLWKG